MREPRIDLARVERCLRELQRAFPRINETLRSRRDALGDDVVANLLEGYAYVNTMLEQGVDPFRRGQHSHLLELNTIVLCGTSPEERRRFHRHIEATEAHFYEVVGGGIREIMEWYDRHRGDDPWRQAAGVYVHALSEPQLFIEGNHRTGSLIISFMLVRAGKPPFVVKPRQCQRLFRPVDADPGDPQAHASGAVAAAQDEENLRGISARACRQARTGQGFGRGGGMRLDGERATRSGRGR